MPCGRIARTTRYMAEIVQRGKLTIFGIDTRKTNNARIISENDFTCILVSPVFLPGPLWDVVWECGVVGVVGWHEKCN